MPISISVCVTKLDKRKFVKGKKGVYADLVLWETPESDYGDFMVKQQGERGERLPILGNAKHFALKGKNAANKREESNGNDNDDASIPF